MTRLLTTTKLTGLAIATLVAGAAMVPAAAPAMAKPKVKIHVHIGGGYGPGWGYGGYGYYNPCRKFLRRYHITGNPFWLKRYNACMF